MKKYLALLSILFLFGCQNDVLTASDNGKTFETTIGKTFRLELNENATTGYRWHFKTDPESQMVLYQTSDTFERPQTNRLGAGGKRIITYQATNVGTIKLMGFHARPWENRDQNIPSVEYIIVVKP